MEPVSEDEKPGPRGASGPVGFPALPAIEEPEGGEAKRVEYPRELAGRPAAPAPAQVLGHRLQGEGNVSLGDLAPLAPARADPDDHVEGERAQRWSRVDALDQAELIGGIEQPHELTASGPWRGGRASKALPSEVRLHAGSVRREAERPRRGEHPRRRRHAA